MGVHGYKTTNGAEPGGQSPHSLLIFDTALICCSLSTDHKYLASAPCLMCGRRF